MTSQQPPEDRTWEEFPAYDPTPSGPGGPVDSPAPDEAVVARSEPGTAATTARSPVNRRTILMASVGAAVGLTAVGLATGRGVFPSEDGGRSGSLALPPQATNLTLVTNSGDVTVRGTNGDLSGTWRGRAGAPQVEQSGDSATVAANSSVDLTLEVPAGVSLQIRTASGDLTIEGADLQALTVETRSGDVEIEDSTVGTLQAETASGDVDLTLTAPPQVVSVTTASGDVEISLPGRGYRYGTDTRSGDVKVPDDSGTLPVDVRTASGDITIDDD